MHASRPTIHARTVLAALLTLGALAACGDTARLPVAAGTGSDPQLPPPRKTLIPTVNIAPAKGWAQGATPVPAAGTTVKAPVAFVNSVTPPSGVTFAFTSLNNTPTADDIEFSNQAPVAGVYAFGYLPVPNALGVDPAVTAIRLNPKGTMAGASGVNNPFFDLRFRVRVK